LLAAAISIRGPAISASLQAGEVDHQLLDLEGSAIGKSDIGQISWNFRITF
jgi:hypothetical protein